MIVQRTSGRLVLLGVIVVSGIGLGYVLNQVATQDSSQPHFTSPPVSDGKLCSKRALLIGVTKYYHLPVAKHLSGPSNDVVLMKQLLEEAYQFSPAGIVTMTENEPDPARRPTRANIEREFLQLAEDAREGDQVVILLAGHGSRQPEKDPPDPNYPEPDGIDEVFLPADADRGKGKPARIPNAIVDDEMRLWLEAITAKKARVWIIFDCCHSGSMARGTEVIRELPPGALIPEEELDRARERVSQRNSVRSSSPEKAASFVPLDSSDYLVAMYACRPLEQTWESKQGGSFHGEFTYTLAGILTHSATSNTPLTYRELIQRVQVDYASRSKGATPTVEGKGQVRVVLGAEQPARPQVLLRRESDRYRVNAGDLHGLTSGSILAVQSPPGMQEEPKLLGHVRVQRTRPFDATVEPCVYEGHPLVKDLPPLAVCFPVFTDYGLRRFKVSIQGTDTRLPSYRRVREALETLAGERGGLVDLTEDPRQADWLLRVDHRKAEFLEASGDQPVFVLPGLETRDLTTSLRQNLQKVDRARNMASLASRFERERCGGTPAVDIEVDVLRQPKGNVGQAEVLRPQPSGWVFRPGDCVKFRIRNKSRSQVDVTLLIISPDYEIYAFYPRTSNEQKCLMPSEDRDTPSGEIGAKPPFGPFRMVVLAAPARNPPEDFTALVQDGLEQGRPPNRGGQLCSPLYKLVENTLFRSNSSTGLSTSESRQYGMRVLTWKVEPR